MVGRAQRSHLQVDLLDAVHVVGHEAEDEAAQAGRDADAHQQQLLVGVGAKALLHVLHLQNGATSTRVIQGRRLGGRGSGGAMGVAADSSVRV